MLEMPRYDFDKTILMTEDLVGFSVAREAFNRRASVRGVLMPYDPFAEDENAEKDLILFAQSFITGEKPTRRLREIDLNDRPVPPVVAVIRNKMRAAFERAANRSMKNFVFGINTTRPNTIHKHEATLVYTLNGEGTVVERPDETLYAVPARHLFMMADRLPHTAPKYNVSVENPRIMFMAF